MAARSAVRRTSFFQRLHPVAIRPEVCYTKKVASRQSPLATFFILFHERIFALLFAPSRLCEKHAFADFTQRREDAKKSAKHC
ncbi:hypothetical protein PLANPX_0222 [Lacipirellula parvula]|uniref:Uncharacterized protein n=1 Tax=Lacipirellula parvula TaxID=2650471 RepID=A0A5K7X2B1_9BACT|nr:hypothetical protein PLANPX_0222 [Lacipirellula parvula]